MHELIILYWIFFVSVATYFVYVHDKHQAHYNLWRVPELLMLSLTFVGGAFGALSAMLLFRHKTHHTSFRICVPVFLAIQVIALVLLNFFVYS